MDSFSCLFVWLGLMRWLMMRGATTGCCLLCWLEIFCNFNFLIFLKSKKRFEWIYKQFSIDSSDRDGISQGW